jgi:prepilin-type N-terminal cleavage/methylation domain-containing protein
MRREAGFSLIELLIVMAIIMVISAMAIPNLLRSRIAANEASAVASVRAINTAQTSYASVYPQIGYADVLTKLAMPQGGAPPDQNHAGFIDWVLGCANQPCPRSGYMFAITNAAGNPVGTYSISGIPQMLNQTGVRGFCSSQTMTITFDPNGGNNCTIALQ